MDKQTIASILKEISILLDLKGENPFKSRAYANAARTITSLNLDLESAARDGTLDSVKGIGKGLAEKISELILTGESSYHAELRAAVPEGLLELVKLPGLGPKKVKALYEKMGITTIGELEYACHENRLVTLDGFGQKTQDNILESIEFAKKYHSRFLYPVALGHAEQIMEFITEKINIKNLTVAGSLRRKMETVKDIDLLAGTVDPEPLTDKFTEYPEIESVIASGETKTSIKLKTGINVDLRVVTTEQFPYALHHFTGSREHNTAMRGRAKKLGYKMNEYGLFKGDTLIPCGDEKEIFQALGLAYIAPELRENLGEIDAAESGSLPELVEETDIQGIFHVHSTYSDGSNSIEELVTAVRKHGWKYLGIADHSRSAAYAGGLTENDIRAQHEEIDRINQDNPDIRILKGIESDILPNGDLDYPDHVLESFDFIIISVHSNFRLPRDQMTDRVIKAMNNHHATMLGHPTGRLLLSREPYEIDLDRVLAVAAETNVIIEINSHPYRLDLDWREIKKAKAQGILLSINPDAHNTEGFTDYRYGIGIARKGWLSKHDILNCMDLKTVDKLLNRRKHS